MREFLDIEGISAGMLPYLFGDVRRNGYPGDRIDEVCGGIAVDAAQTHCRRVVGPDESFEGGPVHRSVGAEKCPVADHMNGQPRELPSQQDQGVDRGWIGAL